ncbi:MAG: prepilin-type N-terminal cleavage/methylation domain-containing protein [Planctomycetota bacterium]
MPTATHPTRPSRRGFTFLEAVLAAALLGIVAAGVLSALGTVWNWELTDRQRLGAAEVANRVMIVYLDDSTATDDLPETIAYDGRRYRWSIDIERVSLLDANPERRVGRDGVAQSPELFDRMQAVTVSAWLDDGTAAAIRAGATPTVTLDRLVNPLGFFSHDSVERLLNDDERLGDMFEEIVGFDRPAGDSGSGGDETQADDASTPR